MPVLYTFCSRTVGTFLCRAGLSVRSLYVQYSSLQTPALLELYSTLHPQFSNTFCSS